MANFLEVVFAFCLICTCHGMSVEPSDTDTMEMDVVPILPDMGMADLDQCNDPSVCAEPLEVPNADTEMGEDLPDCAHYLTSEAVELHYQQVSFGKISPTKPVCKLPFRNLDGSTPYRTGEVVRNYKCVGVVASGRGKTTAEYPEGMYTLGPGDNNFKKLLAASENSISTVSLFKVTCPGEEAPGTVISKQDAIVGSQISIESSIRPNNEVFKGLKAKYQEGWKDPTKGPTPEPEPWDNIVTEQGGYHLHINMVKMSDKRHLPDKVGGAFIKFIFKLAAETGMRIVTLNQQMELPIRVPGGGGFYVKAKKGTAASVKRYEMCTETHPKEIPEGCVAGLAEGKYVVSQTMSKTATVGMQAAPVVGCTVYAMAAYDAGFATAATARCEQTDVANLHWSEQVDERDLSPDPGIAKDELKAGICEHATQAGELMAFFMSKPQEQLPPLPTPSARFRVAVKSGKKQ